MHHQAPIGRPAPPCCLRPKPGPQRPVRPVTPRPAPRPIRPR